MSFLATLLTTSGCAGTVDRHSEYSSKDNSDYTQHTQTSGNNVLDTNNTADVEASFRQGTEAYRQGNLDQAERHFREVLHSQPRHSKATYNISMIYLRRAYDGLSRYSSIETDQIRRRKAQALLTKLDEIGSEN